MVAFIEAGAPAGERRPVANARLLAPLRPSVSPRLPHLQRPPDNALRRLGRPIPDEWFDVPAYYKGLPDTVIGPEETIPWPAYTDRLDHELELAAVIGRSGKDIARRGGVGATSSATRSGTTSPRATSRRASSRSGMGPAKAKDWDGSNVLGPCIVTADELDGTNVRMAVRVNGEVWGEDNSAQHAPHVRRPDRLRLAGADRLPGRGLRLRHGRRAARGSSSTAGCRRETSSSSRSRASACSVTRSDRKGVL